MEAEDLARPSACCVHFATPEEAAAAREALGGQTVATVAAADLDSRGLLDALAAAFDFPPYFGRNWDALEECLRDLGEPGHPGFVLLVEGAAELWTHHYGTAGRLVETWLFCAEEQARDGVPFHLVFVR